MPVGVGGGGEERGHRKSEADFYTTASLVLTSPQVAAANLPKTFSLDGPSRAESESDGESPTSNVPPHPGTPGVMKFLTVPLPL